MKDNIMILICLIPSSILFAGAVYLLTQGVDGWGWLLFVGAIVLPSFSDEKEQTK